MRLLMNRHWGDVISPAHEMLRRDFIRGERHGFIGAGGQMIDKLATAIGFIQRPVVEHRVGDSVQAQAQATRFNFLQALVRIVVAKAGQ